MADMLGGQEEVSPGGCNGIVFGLLLMVIVVASLIIIVVALGRPPGP